jgi:hypothetical protein
MALFDNDPLSASRGMGDRRHWAWCLMDFGNGTYQGAANGLATLLRHGLLPDGFDPERMEQRIGDLFRASLRLTRRDGSLEEAFPFEGSYCVTALVAYDLLTTVEQLGDTLPSSSRDEYLGTISPMIGFLLRSDETHAMISNHLATAVAALCKWQMLTGEAVVQRAEALVRKILKHQSEEGWFSEYGGFDPGYQSLCTYYLAEAHRVQPELGLAEPILKSIRFLWHFAHPDGSFGGNYGSRNTRFFYPGGIESLAGMIPEAASLAAFMRESIRRKTVVTLAAIDEPNLVPTFNAYCQAAALPHHPASEILPIHDDPFQRHFPEAGLFIDHGSDHHTIISTAKGGATYHFVEGRLEICDTGCAAKAGGKIYATQSLQPDNKVKFNEQELVVECTYLPLLRKLPTPLQFILFRILNLSVLRLHAIREWIKQILVSLLITRKGKAIGTNRRTIRLGRDLNIHDATSLVESGKNLPINGAFSQIHMASQGYWQIQDEINLK